MDVPPSVRRLLHEFDLPAELDGAVWVRAVSERVMARGMWADMLWLVRTFGRERLAGFLSERGHRVLPARELRYWATVCHVPERVVDGWVAAARERSREWRRMSPCWSAVTPATASAFRTVSAALAGSDFYLAGGTGLALQIGHRRSLDLDLFSPTLTGVERLLDRLSGALPDLVVTSVAPRTLYAVVAGVQVELLRLLVSAAGATRQGRAGAAAPC